jgi:hypothetical protein
MKRQVIVRVTAIAVATVFVAGTSVMDGQLNFGWLRLFSVAVLLATLALTLLDLWIWRFPLIQRVPGIPRCIRGTWKGTLTSLWIDPATGDSPKPKPVYLVVRQTATLVSVKLLTDESRSASSLAEVAEADGTGVLRYLYLNQPDIRLSHRSRIHHGSVVLVISGNPAKRLKGHYWTDRDSKGELEFFHKDNRLVDDFSDAAALFDETE